MSYKTRFRLHGHFVVPSVALAPYAWLLLAFCQSHRTFLRRSHTLFLLLSGPQDTPFLLLSEIQDAPETLTRDAAPAVAVT